MRVFLVLVKPVDFAQPKNGREGNAGSHQVRFQKGLGLIGSRGFLMVQILLDICIEINFGQE